MIYTALTKDASDFLAWGCGDRTVPFLPDGPRHYKAVQDLLAAGFVAYADSKYGVQCLTVTDKGRAYYALGR